MVFLSGLLAAPFALVPRKRPEPERGRAWIELDAAALRHNVNVLSGLLPEGCALTAVLKANAYGHGDLECARICQKAGIRSFAVATAAEGARLRRGGVRGDILVLGWSGCRGGPAAATLSPDPDGGESGTRPAPGPLRKTPAGPYQDRHRDAPPRYRVG